MNLLDQLRRAVAILVFLEHNAWDIDALGHHVFNVCSVTLQCQRAGCERAQIASALQPLHGLANPSPFVARLKQAAAEI